MQTVKQWKAIIQGQLQQGVNPLLIIVGLTAVALYSSAMVVVVTLIVHSSMLFLAHSYIARALLVSIKESRFMLYILRTSHHAGFNDNRRSLLRLSSTTPLRSAEAPLVSSTITGYWVVANLGFFTGGIGMGGVGVPPLDLAGEAGMLQ